METERIFSYDVNGNLECETLFKIDKNRLRVIVRNNSEKTYVMVHCKDAVIKLDAEPWIKFVKYLPIINNEFNSRFSTKNIQHDNIVPNDVFTPELLVVEDKN